MTRKERHEDEERLEALYREHGDVEPDAGLDWRIRAQAHRRARPTGLPRPAHWLGGAAVAATLLVVVSVVTQIEPPQGELPERVQPDHESTADRDAASAPASASTRRQAVPEGAERRAEPAMRDRAAFEPAPPPAALGEAASSTDAEGASERVLEEERARTIERLTSDRVPLDPELGFPEAKTVPESSTSDEVRRRLWLIEQFIAIGQARRAREEIEAFEQGFPEHEIPVALIARLEQLERLEPSGEPD